MPGSGAAERCGFRTEGVEVRRTPNKTSYLCVCVGVCVILISERKERFFSKVM